MFRVLLLRLRQWTVKCVDRCQTRRLLFQAHHHLQAAGVHCGHHLLLCVKVYTSCQGCGRACVVQRVSRRSGAVLVGFVNRFAWVWAWGWLATSSTVSLHIHMKAAGAKSSTISICDWVLTSCLRGCACGVEGPGCGARMHVLTPLQSVCRAVLTLC